MVVSLCLRTIPPHNPPGSCYSSIHWTGPSTWKLTLGHFSLRLLTRVTFILPGLENGYMWNELSKWVLNKWLCNNRGLGYQNEFLHVHIDHHTKMILIITRGGHFAPGLIHIREHQLTPVLMTFLHLVVNKDAWEDESACFACTALISSTHVP